jgi:hypothetical protein
MPLARKHRLPPKKRRTREHVIADLSVNHVERQVLLCGFSVERIEHDYGIDLILFTYDAEGEIENGEVWLQIKATDRLKMKATQSLVSFRIARTDLRTWLHEPMPVILVVYDAGLEVAYWLYVQAYFEGRAGFDIKKAAATLTVNIPTRQVLNPATVRRFAAFRNNVLAQTRGGIHHE